MISVNDIVDFVLSFPNRKGAYKNFCREAIFTAIKKAIISGRIRIITDENEKITGLCEFTPEPSLKILHINHILSRDKRALKRMVAECVKLYPDFQLQAYRYSELISYGDKTNKLLRRLHLWATT